MPMYQITREQWTHTVAEYGDLAIRINFLWASVLPNRGTGFPIALKLCKTVTQPHAGNQRIFVVANIVIRRRRGRQHVGGNLTLIVKAWR